MMEPNKSDWGFDEIALDDPSRVIALNSCGVADALIEAICEALGAALVRDVRIGFDGINNDLAAPRVTFQFPVSAALYDWFYNARTGYRAQFWASPEAGDAYNFRLLTHVKRVLEHWLPASGLQGRILFVEKQNGDRQDVDTGSRIESRTNVLGSLDPSLSKIWICERLIQLDGKPPLSTLALASRGRKLKIPQWTGYGLEPQNPQQNGGWLDIKGGYVRSSGKAEQPNKAPATRAYQIHCTGWS